VSLILQGIVRPSADSSQPSLQREGTQGTAGSGLLKSQGPPLPSLCPFQINKALTSTELPPRPVVSCLSLLMPLGTEP
jgi:hypothetical protein